MTKRAKEAVHYTARATDLHERCRLCEHFFYVVGLNGRCQKVTGDISPLGWCDLFKRKEK